MEIIDELLIKRKWFDRWSKTQVIFNIILTLTYKHFCGITCTDKPQHHFPPLPPLKVKFTKQASNLTRNLTQLYDFSLFARKQFHQIPKATFLLTTALQFKFGKHSKNFDVDSKIICY